MRIEYTLLIVRNMDLMLLEIRSSVDVVRVMVMVKKELQLMGKGRGCISKSPRCSL